MQPVWFYVLLGRRLKRTLKSTKWRKTIQHYKCDYSLSQCCLFLWLFHDSTTNPNLPQNIDPNFDAITSLCFQKQNKIRFQILSNDLNRVLWESVSMRFRLEDLKTQLPKSTVWCSCDDYDDPGFENVNLWWDLLPMEVSTVSGMKVSTMSNRIYPVLVGKFPKHSEFVGRRKSGRMKQTVTQYECLVAKRNRRNILNLQNRQLFILLWNPMCFLFRNPMHFLCQKDYSYCSLHNV